MLEAAGRQRSRKARGACGELAGRPFLFSDQVLVACLAALMLLTRTAMSMCTRNPSFRIAPARPSCSVPGPRNPKSIERTITSGAGRATGAFDTVTEKMECTFGEPPGAASATYCPGCRWSVFIRRSVLASASNAIVATCSCSRGRSDASFRRGTIRLPRRCSRASGGQITVPSLTLPVAVTTTYRAGCGTAPTVTDVGVTRATASAGSRRPVLRRRWTANDAVTSAPGPGGLSCAEQGVSSDTTSVGPFVQAVTPTGRSRPPVTPI